MYLLSMAIHLINERSIYPLLLLHLVEVKCKLPVFGMARVIGVSDLIPPLQVSGNIPF
jgi:hypothetical protein